ncbi:Ig-like domain-containing protein [Cellulomonas composti]|uniref:Bacterial Ig-like domain-containing protein n=1 Tax=Cellulomonas composti TaxID=266130 RepID=A0A511JD25_9CELL|nr:Ig-like domain-containing protein [Cellulomonas composti]GEL95613.1 hypothetical protein CCO02nite_22710 [Cellulomonas composti]
MTYAWAGNEVVLDGPQLVVKNGVAEIQGNLQIDTDSSFEMRFGVKLATVGHLTRTATPAGLQVVASDVRLAEYGAFLGYDEGTVLDDVHALLATTTPKISSVVDFRSDGSAQVTITGTGFSPSWATGLRGPTTGMLSGVRVAVGTFTSLWEPSDDYLDQNRTTDVAAQSWAVPTATRATAEAAVVADAPPGTAPIDVAELKADGSFKVTVTVDKAAIDAAAPPRHVDGYAIYTYPAGQAYVPAFETVTPITFHDGITSSTSVDPVSAVAGKPVAVTVRTAASGRVPTGTVVVRSAGREVGRATLSQGVATATLAALPVGSHDLAVEYLGDAWVKPSTSAVTVTVVKASAKITGAIPVVTYGTGRSATLTVSAGGVATDGGTLTLRGDGFTRSGVVTAGKVTLALPPKLAPGSYPVTISYGGTSMVAATTRTATLKVVKATSTTTVKVTPASTSATGTPTASVAVTAAGSTPTGTVRLTITGNGKSFVRTVTLSGGKAALQLGARAAGTYTVTAAYLGSATAASSSGTTSYRVV